MNYTESKQFLISKGYWTYVADLSDVQLIEFANKIKNEIDNIDNSKQI